MEVARQIPQKVGELMRFELLGRVLEQFRDRRSGGESARFSCGSFKLRKVAFAHLPVMRQAAFGELREDAADRACAICT